MECMATPRPKVWGHVGQIAEKYQEIKLQGMDYPIKNPASPQGETGL